MARPRSTRARKNSNIIDAILAARSQFLPTIRNLVTKTKEEEESESESETKEEKEVEEEESEYQIFVKTLDGNSIALDVKASDLIAMVKTKIQNIGGIPADRQRLTFNESKLKDAKTIGEYNIKKESVIIMQ